MSTDAKAPRAASDRGRLMATLFAAQILGVWGFTVLNTLGAALVLGPLAATLLRRPALAPLSTPRG